MCYIIPLVQQLAIEVSLLILSREILVFCIPLPSISKGFT